MKNSAHTPGPWSINGFSIDTSEKLVAEVQQDYSDGGYYSDEERNANARLIAAAPDLLAALKQARHRLEKMQSEGYPQDKTLPLVCEAIAKAEGSVE